METGLRRILSLALMVRTFVRALKYNTFPALANSYMFSPLGVNSVVRNFMYPDIKVSSSQNCYRASISLSNLQAEQEIAPLLSTFDFWMGPQHLVIAGPSCDEDQYSIALYHPGNTGTAGNWKKPGELAHMRETFKGFASPLRKLLDIVESSVVWKVVEVPSLPSWISKGGNVVLIGDAAHGMTPYQGQVSDCPTVLFQDIPVLNS